MPQRSRADSPGRTSFRTTDLEAARDWMRSAYGTSLRMKSPAPNGTFSYSRTLAGPVTLSTLALATEYAYASDPLGAVAITHVVSGRMRRECADDAYSAGPGDVFAISQPDLPYTGHVDGAELRAVSLSRRIVEDAAGRLPGRPAPPLRFIRFTPVSPARAEQWKRAVDYLESGVLAGPAAGEPLVVDAAARMIAAHALTTFPNTAHPASVPADTRDATPETVRRAVAFIESAPDAEIGPTEMAAAAGVTPRALQYAFRRHLGTTPTAYLRRVRLDLAHADLVAGDAASGAGVAAIAHRWGFHHLGRFAAAYRAAYGHSPSRTLGESGRAR
ncbi:helix-turn-helix domain-containing protein [Streptomyces sp. NPDC001903]|uniref:helix-turn-helix domain-containing protein n=1 Tax=Streptomyces sp. NPDC001903 TaxID=3364622 RepID=UPI0036CAEB59